MLRISGIVITNDSIDDKWQINRCTREILQKVNLFIMRPFFFGMNHTSQREIEDIQSVIHTHLIYKLI